MFPLWSFCITHLSFAVSRNRESIARVLEKYQGQQLDPHYLGFFECFNQQLFYEAHEILEKLWLPARQGSDGAFYKGLIQLAGAFVHLTKNRLPPAASLLKLAHANLSKYAPTHHRLDTEATLKIIQEWLGQVESGVFTSNSMESLAFPRLFLIS